MNEGKSIAGIGQDSFPPISTPSASVLILGSFPGVLSLEKRRYYAHPRNAFWKIMSNLLRIDPCLDYREKIEILKTSNVALWDVLYRCRRRGSLDAAIESESIVVNDFNEFLQRHRMIQAVYFNGVRAEKEFRKRVLPVIGPAGDKLKLYTLPSTSPAMAMMTVDQKTRAWNVITHYL